MIVINKHNPQIDDLDQLQDFARSAYRTSKNFFGKDVQEIVISFLYSRKEMDQVVGKITPSWLVGNTHGNLINIFSPNVFESVSSHRRSNFMPVLTHEIAHVFTSAIYGKYNNQYPLWFREGIAGLVAGQYQKYDLKQIRKSEFKEISSSNDWNQNPNYPQAFLFTKYLYDQYGKEAFLELLTKATEAKSLADFPQIFTEVTKDSFESVSSNWLK